MKRITVLLLSIVCVLVLVACSGAGDDDFDTSKPFFGGRVIEKYETTCLMEVTDMGNGHFSLGERVVVATNIDRCPDFDAGDYLRISFDGKVAYSYPPQVLSVQAIVNTDSSGNTMK